MTDKEIRLKCLELAILRTSQLSNNALTFDIDTRSMALAYLQFIKGDNEAAI